MIMKKGLKQRLADLEDVLNVVEDIMAGIASGRFIDGGKDEFIAMLRIMKDKLERSHPDNYRSNFVSKYLHGHDILRKEKMLLDYVNAIYHWADIKLVSDQ